MDVLVRLVSKVTSLCPAGRSTLLAHSLTFALLCSRPRHYALQSVRQSVRLVRPATSLLGCCVWRNLRRRRSSVSTSDTARRSWLRAVRHCARRHTERSQLLGCGRWRRRGIWQRKTLSWSSTTDSRNHTLCDNEPSTRRRWLTVGVLLQSHRHTSITIPPSTIANLLSYCTLPVQSPPLSHMFNRDFFVLVADTMNACCDDSSRNRIKYLFGSQFGWSQHKQYIQTSAAGMKFHRQLLKRDKTKKNKKDSSGDDCGENCGDGFSNICSDWLL